MPYSAYSGTSTDLPVITLASGRTIPIFRLDIGSGTAENQVTTTMPVTGPLTDAQLRAAVIPVSVPAGVVVTADVPSPNTWVDFTNVTVTQAAAIQVLAANTNRRYASVCNVGAQPCWMGPSAAEISDTQGPWYVPTLATVFVDGRFAVFARATSAGTTTIAPAEYL